MTARTATRTQAARTAPARLMLAIVLGGQAMATLDGSIVNVALPSIRAQLSASGAQLQLVAAAYLLAFAALVVTGARLGDRHGHARMFRAGLAGFTVASLACGLAPSAVTLIAARLAQGAGGAVMVAQVISMIHLGFQGPARAKAIAYYSLVLALGVAAGQILGGVIVSADLFGLGWRPIFLVNLPAGLVILAATTKLSPAAATGTAGRLDLAGASILAGSTAAIVGPLSLGQERGWPAWSIIALTSGAGGLAIFLWYERRLANGGREPLLDLRVLRPPGVRSGLAGCLLVMGGYAAFVFTLTLYLQNGIGFSPLRSGLTFVPFAAGFGAASLSWTRLPAQVSRWMPVFGPIAFAAGITAITSLATDGWPVAAGVVLLAVAGAGHAASFSPLFARVSGLIDTEFAAALSAVSNTATLLVGAVMVAGLGGVYLSTTAHNRYAAAHLGLAHVVLAIDAILVITTACAGWTITRSGPRS